MDSDFNLAGIAAVGATFFTNPFEVIKTRIQLQGELAKRGTYVKPYKGVLHAFITVAKHDGLLGLQKGLVPALYFQYVINSFRLSIYSTALKKGWVSDRKGNISFGLGLFWGATGGIIGSFCSSPFFMIKTQLQAQAAEAIAVGHQHKHRSMFHALNEIYGKRGILGLWRGALATIPRSAIGSAAQIATFGSAKEFLRETQIVTHHVYNSFWAGVIAGTVTTLAITPPDVITTRIYNQGLDERGRGLLYNGYTDCVMKIVRTEGIYGLYKGFWPNYLRMGPHSTLVLLFFDELMELRNSRFIKDE